MAPLAGTRTPSIPAPRRSGAGGDRSERHALFRLAADPASVRHARREARAELERWGLPEGVCDDAVLVVSELVTNAVVHAVSEVVVCRLRGGGHEVRVEVGAEGHSAARTDARAAGECGRGLAVVEALSAEWGTEVATPGGAWTAWARIAAAPVSAPSADAGSGAGAASGAASAGSVETADAVGAAGGAARSAGSR